MECIISPSVLLMTTTAKLEDGSVCMINEESAARLLVTVWQYHYCLQADRPFSISHCNLFTAPRDSEGGALMVYISNCLQITILFMVALLAAPSDSEGGAMMVVVLLNSSRDCDSFYGGITN